MEEVEPLGANSILEPLIELLRQRCIKCHCLFANGNSKSPKRGTKRLNLWSEDELKEQNRLRDGFLYSAIGVCYPCKKSLDPSTVPQMVLSALLERPTYTRTAHALFFCFRIRLSP